MPRRYEIPDGLAGQPFRNSEALALGVGRGRLRSSDLERPFHGVRRVREVGADPIADYAARMSEHQFFSHVSAAKLHGLPLPTRLERQSDIHVCVAKPARAPRLDGVIGHHVEAGSVELVTVAGFSVTSPVDTWCLLSTLLSVDELIAVGDALVRRQSPLCTMEQLTRTAGRFSGHRGSRRLNAALRDVRPRTDSVRETRLRLLIVRADLPEPEVNYEITDQFGAFVAFGDLAFPEYRVLTEYDGEQHRTDDRQYHRDVDRLAAIAEQGWTWCASTSRTLVPKRSRA